MVQFYIIKNADMKTLTKIIPLAVSLFFIILFIYAAASKMLDFENFQVQLAQSPLLSAYAGFVSYGVIILELVIVGLLCFHASRLLGLYASFAIMIAFTVYIFLILNYSDFVPCSCGGILEKMGWTEHLIFNIGCVVMAGLAIIAAYPVPLQLSALTHSEEDWMKNYRQRKRIRWMLAYKMATLLVLPAGLMVALFISSEHIIKKENNFTRRFLQFPVVEDQVLTLNNDQYYFAGNNSGYIYLGNRQNPQFLSTVDTIFSTVTDLKITPDQIKLPFKNVQLQAKAPFYYVMDGTVPIIFRGKIGSSLVKTISHHDAYFNQIKVLDSVNFALRTQNSQNMQLTLASLRLDSTRQVKLHPNILKKQTDGVFDSDGMLVCSEHPQRLIYMYSYRNQFLVMDTLMNVIHTYNTIDTTSVAKIKTKALQNGLHKMTTPPLTVNQIIAAHRNVAFIHSKLKGRFESAKSWNSSSVIDVYRTDRQEYIGSFYIDKKGKSAMTDLMITDRYLYVLIGNQLVRYAYRKPIKELLQGKPKT